MYADKKLEELERALNRHKFIMLITTVSLWFMIFGTAYMLDVVKNKVDTLYAITYGENVNE